ncbi:antibiotic biosynthesis monooxygenase [Malaciobacter molluscorum LMG 25693]|uniref:Monooxygenase n=1 Tax=Malaciobacter molluscorum LMG 25693 TaxID=870501 RepID=A0A2G1DJX1_9BACT|nr:putative quinol monooxygenase [Malaciobacter molluscorum]AXX92858.1 monooxygenase [Malaciobacter molluscorum LMG 25693]PHO18694.1 antibiotic biosynthesis monooxygenase [Malaciobacter molluscorum LMG 25693]
MIIAIVKAKIKSGMHAKLRETADILQYEFSKNEPGCEQYESFIDGDVFITLERWTDQACLDQHLEAEHVKKYVPELRKCVENGEFSVQFIETDNINFITI